MRASDEGEDGVKDAAVEDHVAQSWTIAGDVDNGPDLLRTSLSFGRGKQADIDGNGAGLSHA